MAKKQYSTIDMNGNKITGLATPTTQQTTSAANVQFVLDNAGGAPTASNVSFTPDADTFPAGTDNVDEALKALFTSANSGKLDVADSIGYSTPYSDTFASLAGNIDTTKTALTTFLPNAEKTLNGNEKLHELGAMLSDVRVFKQSAKLNKEQGTTTVIDLKQYNGSFPTKQNICVMPMVRISDSATTQLYADFNNGAPENFITNNFIEFTGGVARIKTDYTENFGSPDANNIREVTVNLTGLSTFQVLSLSSANIQYRGFPDSQVLIPTASINITNVIDIASFTGTTGANTYSFTSSLLFPQVAIQCGETAPYYALDVDTQEWQVVDVNDIGDFGAKGNNSLSVFNMTNIDVLRNLPGNNKNQIRFAYLFVSGYNAVTRFLGQTDNINFNVIMSGSFVPANQTGATGTPPQVDYNESNGKLTITYNQLGFDSYIINYLDKP